MDGADRPRTVEKRRVAEERPREKGLQKPPRKMTERTPTWSTRGCSQRDKARGGEKGWEGEKGEKGGKKGNTEREMWGEAIFSAGGGETAGQRVQRSCSHERRLGDHYGGERGG